MLDAISLLFPEECYLALKAESRVSKKSFSETLDSKLTMQIHAGKTSDHSILDQGMTLI